MASLALTLVDGILSEFGSLIASQSVPYFRFACCFKREWSKLKNTLSTIRGIILDLQVKLEMTNIEEERLRRLEEILKDGRDLVDKVAEVQKPVDANRNMADEVLNFFSTLWFYVVLPCKIKTIRDRLTDAAKDHADFPGVDFKDQYIIKSYKPPAFKTQTTGREADKEAIRKRIKEYSNSDKANVSIIPIVAMGGMGKTTLAKLIYENEEDFRLKMWVDVSPDFDQKKLVEKVILAGTGKACDPNLGRDQLEQRLRNLLDGRKYMLVLDDVWETNPLRWDAFQHLLMGGARGSVILVTTRYNAVGQITSNTGEPYKLEGLSDDHSWSLFKHKVSKPELMEQNLKLLLLGKKILEKCWGNPLAITTVARLLSDRQADHEWLEVKNLLWGLAEEDTDILPILKISYQHLSPHLQKCFAHCALFPKGYRIEKATLIQLWMAEEEFIQPLGKRILEDIGNGYFKTLLRRNFFEDEEKDEWDNITSCKMHDLMHDLAQTAEGMDNYSIIRNNDDEANISEKVMHATISKELATFPTSILKAKYLRTFISVVKPIPIPGPVELVILVALRINIVLTPMEERTAKSEEDFAKFASTFESLRVLSLAPFCGREVLNLWDLTPNLLNPIGKLKQLRYLDLSHSTINTFPNSVCELQNLQTLKLCECRHLKELPRDIKELKSLRHLENKRCDALKGIPCGIGQLTCLQTLSLFVLGEGAGLSELATLNNLRGDLEIQIRENAATSVESRKACLKEKQYLQTLKLALQESNGVEVSLEALQPNPNLSVLTIDGYGGDQFPSWMLNLGNSLPYIVKIAVTNCRRCESFPPFADFLRLKELTLSHLHSLEYIDSYSSSSFFSSLEGRFPSLKKVYLLGLPKLKEWTRVVNDGGNAKTEAVAEQPTQQLLSLNSLEELTIVKCPELTSMPLHPNVEELKLEDVSGVLIESMTMAATVSPTAASTSLLPSSFTFSKLKSLQISGCKDPMSLGEGWLRNLTSLERLEILKCPELNFSDEGNDMPGLISLRSLRLSNLPKLAALPKVLQRSTALETLEIAECPGLMTLPDWFGKLTSLRQLEIFHCSELKSLPEGMRCLTALQELKICLCPHLSETCRKEMGKDWPKIAHIQMVEIDLQRL